MTVRPSQFYLVPCWTMATHVGYLGQHSRIGNNVKHVASLTKLRVLRLKT